MNFLHKCFILVPLAFYFISCSKDGNPSPKVPASLVKVSSENAGVNCPAGGSKIQVGPDSNFNGVLEDSEVTSTAYACNGISFSGDKQLRLVFPGVLGHSTTSTEWQEVAGVQLLKFNKAHYSQVDSIVFNSNIITSANDTNCMVELINLTDNTVISSSTIKTNSTTVVPIYSKNMYQELPNKEITLGVRMRSDREGTFVSAYVFQLFLYRK